MHDSQTQFCRSMDKHERLHDANAHQWHPDPDGFPGVSIMSLCIRGSDDSADAKARSSQAGSLTCQTMGRKIFIAFFKNIRHSQEKLVWAKNPVCIESTSLYSLLKFNTSLFFEKRGSWITIHQTTHTNISIASQLLKDSLTKTHEVRQRL